jgi:hypothetical protein
VIVFSGRAEWKTLNYNLKFSDHEIGDMKESKLNKFVENWKRLLKWILIIHLLSCKWKLRKLLRTGTGNDGAASATDASFFRSTLCLDLGSNANLRAVFAVSGLLDGP